MSVSSRRPKLADVNLLAEQVSDQLLDDLRVKVMPHHSEPRRFYVELHDRKGRACDLHLGSLPATYAYLDAMRDTLRIVGRDERYA